MQNQHIRVVVGIIQNSQQQIFLTKRQAHQDFPNYLEFPGGKAENGESLITALKRELTEELGIIVEKSSPFCQFTYDYPHKSIDFTFFLVESWQGIPQGKEGQKGGWFEINNLTSNQFPDANAQVLRQLQYQS